MNENSIQYNSDKNNCFVSVGFNNIRITSGCPHYC